MLENMYHTMTYDELARETMRSDNKLTVLEMCDDTLEIERSGFEAVLEEMNGMLRILVNDLIEAKGAKRKSQEAIQRFKERCEKKIMVYIKCIPY